MRLRYPLRRVLDRRHLVGAARAGASGAAGRLGVAAGGPIEHVATATEYISAGSSATHTLADVAVSNTNNNRMLIAFSSVNMGTPDVTGITYNGVSLTFGEGQDRAVLFYMPDADLPDDGVNHDIVASYDGASNLVALGAVEYKNVGQGGPTDSDYVITGGGALASTTLIGLAAGSLAVKVAGSSGNNIFVDGEGETSRYSFAAGVSRQGITFTDIIGADGDTTMTSDPPGSPTSQQSSIGFPPVA